jgi:hypothetical protein
MKVTIDYRQVRYWQSFTKGVKLRAPGFCIRLFRRLVHG